MNETVRQGLGIWGDNQVNAVTEAETAFMELTRQLGCAEDTICQLREERDATLKKLASTEGFLNEQLYEWEEERRKNLALEKHYKELRSRLKYLEEKHQQQCRSPSLDIAVSTPQPQVTQVSPSGHSQRNSWEQSALWDSNHHEHLLRQIESTSDVDESSAFELTASPPVKVVTPVRRDWSRPSNAGDCITPQRPPSRTSVAVGDSPFEHIDVSISAQSSMSEVSSSSYSSTEFDNIDHADVTDDEVVEVEGTGTRDAAAELGIRTAYRINKPHHTTKATAFLKADATGNGKTRDSRHLRGGVEATSDGKQIPAVASVGLDAELRHVEEMALLRDALSHAQTSLLEKDNELVVLRQRLSVFETTKTTNPEPTSSPFDGDRLEADLEEAKAEISALRAEIDGLINYQDDLHRDLELAQSSAEERLSEVERLQQELLAAGPPQRRKQHSVAASKFKVVEERDEDLYNLNEEKEALASRVKELESEIALLRPTMSSGEFIEAASQTDSAISSNSDFGSQSDANVMPQILTEQIEIDAPNEEDISLERAFRTPQIITEQRMEQRHESSQLSSLSSAEESSLSEDIDSSDYKSQAILRLIVANQQLKNVIEKLDKQQNEATEVMSNALYVSLLSAILSDRQANLSLITSATIDRASTAAFFGNLSPFPHSGPARSSPKTCSINDVMETLASYAIAEEERWRVLTSALESDRSAIMNEAENLRRQQNSLLNEVVCLTDALACSEDALVQKTRKFQQLIQCTLDLTKHLEEVGTELEDARLRRREEQKRSFSLEKTLAETRQSFIREQNKRVYLERCLQATRHSHER